MTSKLKDLNEKIIPDFLNIRISSTMSVPTLRALEAIYTLRSWLSGASHDINDAAYANLQVQRMWQILKALKTKYRKARTLNEKIEILSFIDTLEQDLSCKNSDFSIEEATKLLTKYSGNSSGKSKHSDRSDNDLTPFQHLRLQLITKALGSDFSEIATASGTNLSQLATELLPKTNTPFDLGTLTLIEHRLPHSLREAIFNRFTHLLEAAIQQLTTDNQQLSLLASLLTLFPYWNSNPIHRSLLKDLSEKADKALKETQKATNLDSDPSEVRIISRLNPIAAEIYTKIDTLTSLHTQSSKLNTCA